MRKFTSIDLMPLSIYLANPRTLAEIAEHLGITERAAKDRLYFLRKFYDVLAKRQAGDHGRNTYEIVAPTRWGRKMEK